MNKLKRLEFKQYRSLTAQNIETFFSQISTLLIPKVIVKDLPNDLKFITKKNNPKDKEKFDPLWFQKLIEICLIKQANWEPTKVTKKISILKIKNDKQAFLLFQKTLAQNIPNNSAHPTTLILDGISVEENDEMMININKNDEKQLIFSEIIIENICEIIKILINDKMILKEIFDHHVIINEIINLLKIVISYYQNFTMNKYLSKIREFLLFFFFELQEKEYLSLQQEKIIVNNLIKLFKLPKYEKITFQFNKKETKRYLIKEMKLKAIKLKNFLNIPQEKLKEIEFQNKISILNFFHLLIISSHSKKIQEVIYDNKEFLKLTDFILWVSMNFKPMKINNNQKKKKRTNKNQNDHNNNSNSDKYLLPYNVPISSKNQNISLKMLTNNQTNEFISNTSKLTLLFRKLTELCSISSINKKNLKRIILLSCINIFKYHDDDNTRNNEAKDYIKYECPLLQLYCLKFFFMNIFQIEEFKLLVKNDIWKTLFSSFFYPLKSDPNHYLILQAKDLLKSIKIYLFQFLKVFIIKGFELKKLIIFKDFMKILNSLILKNFKELNFKILNDIILLLIDLTNYNNNIILFAMVKYKLVNVLFSVINDCYKLSKKIINSNNQDDNILLFSQRHFIKCRYSLFVLLGKILNIKKILNYCIVNSLINRIFLNLLFEKESQNYIIEILNKIMELPIEKSNDDDYNRFFSHYLQFIEFQLITQENIFKWKFDNRNENRGLDKNNHGENSQLINNNNTDIIIILIEIIINGIQKNRMELQKHFIKNNVYNLILIILSNFQNQEQLQYNILLLLKSLFWKNFNNISKFENEIGFVNLEKLISFNNDKHFQILLDLLINNGSFSIENNYKIQVPQMIMIIFRIYSIENRNSLIKLKQLIQIFQNICNKCIENCTSCLNIGLIEYLCKQLIPSVLSIKSGVPLFNEIIDLIAIIGKNSMNVPQLKTIFSLFQSRLINNNFHYLNLLINCFERMLSKNSNNNDDDISSSSNIVNNKNNNKNGNDNNNNDEYDDDDDNNNNNNNNKNNPNSLLNVEEPIYSFNFNGFNSHLVLPEMENWFQNKKFTFYTWLNYQTNPKINDQYFPRILSFLNQSNQGFEFLIENFGKHFSIILYNKLITKKIKFEINLKKNCWYFICLVKNFSYFQSFNNQIYHFHNFSLYLNNKLVENKEIIFHFPQGIKFTHNRIGSNFKIKSKNWNLDQENFFLGKLGEINILLNCLNFNQILDIFNLGPNYIYNKFFYDNLNNEFNYKFRYNDKKISTNQTNINSLNFLKNYLLKYDPKGCNDKYCFDQNCNSIKLNTSLKIGITNVIKTPFHNLIYCFDLKIFFGLLFQLISINNNNKNQKSLIINNLQEKLLGKSNKENENELEEKINNYENQKEIGKINGNVNEKGNEKRKRKGYKNENEKEKEREKEKRNDEDETWEKQRNESEKTNKEKNNESKKEIKNTKKLQENQKKEKVKNFGIERKKKKKI
ncbi:hypothetical protein M0812_11558 [Anaeramoeba flamelloides]|uniref:Uncharacterized protein n=1 Tax=Anaeramoeba flamelloides TaxID=1746091 RepID=A0AAV7ZX34_9EUKA|nr:hypothetical protein M0812_11558 [Anaeramoeba flamelloides]